MQLPAGQPAGQSADVAPVVRQEFLEQPFGGRGDLDQERTPVARVEYPVHQRPPRQGVDQASEVGAPNRQQIRQFAHRDRLLHPVQHAERLELAQVEFVGRQLRRMRAVYRRDRAVEQHHHGERLRVEIIASLTRAANDLVGHRQPRLPDGGSIGGLRAHLCSLVPRILGYAAKLYHRKLVDIDIYIPVLFRCCAICATQVTGGWSWARCWESVYRITRR